MKERGKTPVQFWSPGLVAQDDSVVFNVNPSSRIVRFQGLNIEATGLTKAALLATDSTWSQAKCFCHHEPGANYSYQKLTAPDPREAFGVRRQSAASTAPSEEDTRWF